MNKNLKEAVIFNYKERGKGFVDELANYFKTNKTISLSNLAKMASSYDIEVVDYDTFYDELPDLWKKGEIPPRNASVFGLANPNTNKARLVFGSRIIEDYLFSLIKIIVSHEFVHVGQAERMKPGVIYIPPKTVFDKKIYYSDYREIMAWSKTIVDEIIDKAKPKTFEQAMELLPTGKYYNQIKKAVGKDPKVWNKYLKNIYNYMKLEFEKQNEEKLDLNELKKLIKKIIHEEEKIKINHAYFQKLLDNSNTNITNRNYIQGIINSVRKSGGLGTKRQYQVLKRFETGGDPYSSKN